MNPPDTNRTKFIEHLIVNLNKPYWQDDTLDGDGQDLEDKLRAILNALFAFGVSS